MLTEEELLATIFVLSCFLGYFVVRGVTPALHSPLMSVSNALSGIVIVGALTATLETEVPLARFLGLVAVFLSAVNIFGGFAVSARMLRFFRKKDRK
jgi:NAD(P) transhydrogenase subunit alpha